MRHAGDGAAALGRDDGAQRALQVGLVLHVQSVQLLRRQHVLQRLGPLIELVLLGLQQLDRLVDVDRRRRRASIVSAALASRLSICAVSSASRSRYSRSSLP